MSIAWQLSDDGSFFLVAGQVSLGPCYPAMEGEAVHPLSVHVSRTPDGGTIRYVLSEGRAIELLLGSDAGGAFLDTSLSGFTRLPWRIAPMAGQLHSIDQLFILGLGFSGPSGWHTLNPASQLQSHESYLATAFTGQGTAIAAGALQHADYLQKTIISNRQTRRGLTNRQVESASYSAEFAFFTESIPASGTVQLPRLRFTHAPAAFDALRGLATEIAAEMHCRADHPPFYHWCSWYEKGCNFTLADLKETLAGLKSMPNPPAFQTIQIDDGYCPSPGDWLTPNHLWPGGLPEAFSQIRSAGYRAGVWVSPFMVGSLSNRFREHPDWIVRDHSGKPIVEWKKYDASGIPSHIDPEHYALDASHPGVQEYIRHVFHTLRSWGATFYKTDFMDWGLRDTAGVRRHNPNETSVQSFRKVLQIIREEIGDDSWWLACISPYAPFLGYADAMRIANDVGPGWGDGSQGNMIQESIATQFMNNVFWQCDPDAILLRDYHSELTGTEVRTLALFQGFLGSAVNFSDRVDKLPPDRQELVRFLQPPAKATTAEVPLWQQGGERGEMRGSIRLLSRRYSGGRSAVLAVNASAQRQVEIFPVSALIGLASSHVWTWDPNVGVCPLGEQDSLTVQLRPHDAALYFFGPAGAVPPKHLMGD